MLLIWYKILEVKKLLYMDYSVVDEAHHPQHYNPCTTTFHLQNFYTHL